ncbi:uncharacterized protein K452DRAFT_236620 [Aplosporella prunicola CBS 121167]|uniref:PrpF protein n=1 Tax=Aplosporella prunicola CBS 121167 TaxID=1176127 RepID=A0A6A6AYL3_9PEZI|nr:uncharacterized protein K452DRAFT_236620 [Aplosporella prunicola CBS 121167]KAF2137019.1 hypothetical protein K452DRAFT_236620 [Aplosporella prunicola CBS 121167]
MALPHRPAQTTLRLPRALPLARRHFHTSPRPRTQHSLPASYYRGGTSRAIMFSRADLPASRAAWSPIFLGALGSPDPQHGRQLDGLGGGISSLSKVCVVGASERADADVEFTFVAVGVRDAEVDFSSNCGNMLAAVGPFAVDRGIVHVGEGDGETVVRIFNTNTGKIIKARFAVEGGEAVARGGFAIDGVSGTGAKVELAFLDPAGSKTGALLPTSSPTTTLDTNVPATCIDVGNPCVFVPAAALGLPTPLPLPDAIDADPALLARLERIRRQAGKAMRLCASAADCPASVPKIAVVSPAPQPSDVDLVVRALSVGQPHRAVPITVALALAAASRIEGTVVSDVVPAKRVDECGVTVGHPSGRLLVTARFGKDGAVSEATVFRTARRLMMGTVFWK